VLFGPSAAARHAKVDSMSPLPANPFVPTGTCVINWATRKGLIIAAVDDGVSGDYLASPSYHTHTHRLPQPCYTCLI
jgi:hypothetical protein